MALLLALPLELQLHILALLPLSSQLLLTYQVCAALRRRLHPLLLPSHTLSLAAWRIAAEETRHILARCDQEDVPGTPQHVAKHASRVHLGAHTSPATDARLLVRVLRLLQLLDGREPSETPSSVPRLPSPAPAQALRALCLIGWRGVGADLVRRLLCEPALAEVCTVVKTERYDRHAWTRPLAPHERSAPISVSEGGNSALTHQYPPASVPSEHLPGGGDDSAVASAPLVVVTQAMLVIGSRQAPHQRIAGKGVQVGYEALCFAPSSAGDTPAAAAEGAEEAGACVPDQPLHVIFQGRYSAADALQCEAQLHCSHIRCGHCRSEIWFG